MSIPGNDIQPTPEAPASRWARDGQARRGDHQIAVDAQGKPVLDSRGWTTLTYDSDGRLQNEYLQRRGDHYVVDNEDGTQSLSYDPNGRNDREYVNRQTGISAITNGKGDRFDDLTHED